MGISRVLHDHQNRTKASLTLTLLKAFGEEAARTENKGARRLQNYSRGLPVAHGTHFAHPCARLTTSIFLFA